MKIVYVKTYLHLTNSFPRRRVLKLTDSFPGTLNLEWIISLLISTFLIPFQSTMKLQKQFLCLIKALLRFATNNHVNSIRTKTIYSINIGNNMVIRIVRCDMVFQRVQPKPFSKMAVLEGWEGRWKEDGRGGGDGIWKEGEMEGMGGLKKFSLVFGLIGCIFNFLFFNRRIPFIVKILTL